MSNHTLPQITLDKFPEAIALLLSRLDILQDDVSELKKSVNPEEKLISPATACEVFEPKISKVTLQKWTDNGHLISYRIGGRVFYKSSELIEAAKRLRKYKIGKTISEQ